MKKTLVVLLFATLAMGKLYAQQDPHYSLYMFNGLFLNPAYAGSHEVIDVMAIYRHQWAGIEGAPRTGNGSVHAPLRRNQYALGLTLQGDRLGLTNSFGATGAFAYRIKTGKTKLALGIQAGVTYYQQRNSDANTELTQLGINDAVFQVNRNVAVPNIGFGVYWYGKRGYIGASAPHLLPTTLSKKIGVSDNKSVARQYNHYLFTAGYLIGKETWAVKIRPTMLMKYAPGLNKNIPDFDMGLAAFIVDRFMIGVNYRMGTQIDAKYGSTAISGLLMAKVTPRLRIGYAYEHTLTQINQGVRFGTHDVMLGYEFNTGNKRLVSPRFVSYF